MTAGKDPFNVNDLKVVFDEVAATVGAPPLSPLAEKPFYRFLDIMQRRMLVLADKITLYRHVTEKYAQAQNDPALQEQILKIYGKVYLMNTQFELRNITPKDITNLDKLAQDIETASALKEKIDTGDYETLRTIYLNRHSHNINMTEIGNVNPPAMEVYEACIEFMTGVGAQFTQCEIEIATRLRESSPEVVQTWHAFEEDVAPLKEALKALGPFDTFKSYDGVVFEHAEASAKNNKKMGQFMEKSLKGMDEKIHDWERVETIGKILDLRNELAANPDMMEFAKLFTWKFNSENYIAFANAYSEDLEKTKVFLNKNCLKIAKTPPKFTVGGVTDNSRYTAKI